MAGQGRRVVSQRPAERGRVTTWVFTRTMWVQGKVERGGKPPCSHRPRVNEAVQ